MDLRAMREFWEEEDGCAVHHTPFEVDMLRGAICPGCEAEAAHYTRPRLNWVIAIWLLWMLGPVAIVWIAR